jgi:hypothetical protein
MRREPPPVRKNFNADHTSPGDLGHRRIHPRPGARRVCPPSRRRIAAAGSGRMPNAPRSSTEAVGGDATDDVNGGRYRAICRERADLVLPTGRLTPSRRLRGPARGPVSGSSVLVRRFFRLAYPGWQSFPRAPRGRQRRPPISTDSLLERDGFGLPVPSASHETINRQGRRDCCLGEGERIWCGTEGSNPSPSSSQSVSPVYRGAVGEKPRTLAAVCGWLGTSEGTCRLRTGPPSPFLSDGH